MADTIFFQDLPLADRDRSWNGDETGRVRGQLARHYDKDARDCAVGTVKVRGVEPQS